MGKEIIEEGLGVGIILVSPDENMHSYAIRLKFNASDHAIDCEALLAGLAASISKGMKDLHVFMDSLKLVAQIEGNHTPTMEQEKRYKKEIMDATAPFHRFRITHLPKILNSKAEVLTGLATIKLEFLNQEVSIGIKTRPLVEETSSSKKGKARRIRSQGGDTVILPANNSDEQRRGENRVGGMTQDPLDGQQHIYSQFASSSEQQVSVGIPRAPPLTENGLTNRREKLNLNLEGLAAASSSTMEEGDDIK
ncbi:reverse transcriptase domain-containing protein [Tanacetum coccineum]